MGVLMRWCGRDNDMVPARIDGNGSTMAFAGSFPEDGLSTLAMLKTSGRQNLDPSAVVAHSFNPFSIPG